MTTIPLVITIEGEVWHRFESAPSSLDHLFFELFEINEQITKDKFILWGRETEENAWVRVETQEDYNSEVRCAMAEDKPLIELELREKQNELEGSGWSRLLTNSINHGLYENRHSGSKFDGIGANEYEEKDELNLSNHMVDTKPQIVVSSPIEKQATPIKPDNSNAFSIAQNSVPSTQAPSLEDWRSILLQRYYECKFLQLRQKLIEQAPPTQPDELNRETVAGDNSTFMNESQNNDNGVSFEIGQDISQINPIKDQSETFHPDTIMEDTYAFFQPKKLGLKESKNSQLEKTSKRYNKKNTRECFGCGMKPLHGLAYVCKQCKDMYLCHNCQCDSENILHEADHSFEALEDEHAFTGGPLQLSRWQSSQAGMLGRSSMGPFGSRLTECKFQFFNKNLHWVWKPGKFINVSVELKNTGEIYLPQESVLKNIIPGTLESIAIGEVAPGSKKAFEIALGWDQSPVINLDYRILNSKTNSFMGPYLRITVNHHNTKGDNWEAKVAVRNLEEVYMKGNLIKVFAFCSSSDDSKIATTRTSVTLKEHTGQEEYDFNRVISEDLTEKEGEEFFDEVLQGSIETLMNSQSVVIFNQKVAQMRNSWFIEGNFSTGETGVVRRAARMLLNCKSIARIEFGCFKLNNELIFDMNDNGAIKALKQESNSGKYHVEGLKLCDVETIELFDLMVDHLFSAGRQDPLPYHWVYLFKIRLLNEKRKQFSSSFSIVSLASPQIARDLYSNRDYQIHYKSIQESLNIFKQLIISLSDNKYVSKNSQKINSENKSRLTSLLQQHLFTDTMIRFVFEISTYDDASESEVKDMMLLAKQLRKAKKQV